MLLMKFIRLIQNFILFYNIFLLILFYPVDSLVNNLFIPNFASPRKDLIYLPKNQANFICKNWMANILLSFEINKNKDNFKTFKCDDFHILQSINRFNMNSNEKIHFGWKPESLHNNEQILFIVTVDFDMNKKMIYVDDLVQSPFWNSNQIESIFLKNSLISYNHYINGTTINFDHLYEKYPRYQLAWENWYK